MQPGGGKEPQELRPPASGVDLGGAGWLCSGVSGGGFEMTPEEEMVIGNRCLEIENTCLDDALEDARDQRNVLAVVASIGWGLLTAVLFYTAFHGGN